MAKSKAKQALEFFRREAARAETGTDLHNVFFGNGAEFGRLFTTRAEREAFFKTREFREIARIQDELDQRTRRTAGRRSA
jgi:hypothetical protein